MKIYYASKNRKKYHKQDPDYFVFRPKNGENDDRGIVGKIYKNRSKKGLQYLKILIFKDEEEKVVKESI